MHGVVPDHSSKQYSPALQMLQLLMNIRRKGLEILTPAVPAHPPSNCVSTLCLPAGMHVVRSSTPSLSFRILKNYDQTLVFAKAWKHVQFMRVVAVHNKSSFLKEFKQNQ